VGPLHPHAANVSQVGTLMCGIIDSNSEPDSPLRRSESKSEISTTNVRLVLMSDPNGRHRDIEVPDGDLLIHASDFTCFNGSTFAIRDFNDW
jgi:hypothetical protein